MTKYSVSYQEKPNHDDIQILINGIQQNAKQKKGHAAIESFAFFIRDENNKVLGGCSGAMFYGCLYIDLLWVDETLRLKKFGTQLMQKAEMLGKEKGCVFSAVNTMDFEALEFYQKLGYEIEFERRGFLKDSIFYFLRKSFR